jgi:hypothetical protein
MYTAKFAQDRGRELAVLWRDNRFLDVQLGVLPRAVKPRIGHRTQLVAASFPNTLSSNKAVRKPYDAQVF